MVRLEIRCATVLRGRKLALYCLLRVRLGRMQQRLEFFAQSVTIVHQLLDIASIAQASLVFDGLVEKVLRQLIANAKSFGGHHNAGDGQLTRIVFEEGRDLQCSQETNVLDNVNTKLECFKPIASINKPSKDKRLLWRGPIQIEPSPGNN